MYTIYTFDLVDSEITDICSVENADDAQPIMEALSYVLPKHLELDLRFDEVEEAL